MTISRDTFDAWWHETQIALYHRLVTLKVRMADRRPILERAYTRTRAAAPHCDAVAELYAIALTAFPQTPKED